MRLYRGIALRNTILSIKSHQSGVFQTVPVLGNLSLPCAQPHPERWLLFRGKRFLNTCGLGSTSTAEPHCQLKQHRSSAGKQGPSSPPQLPELFTHFFTLASPLGIRRSFFFFRIFTALLHRVSESSISLTLP